VKSSIITPDPAAEVFTPERCWILENLNEGAGGISVARARVESGVTTRLHSLRGVVERYLVATGTGEVEIAGGPPRVVAPEDVVVIPPGVSQRITNTGDGDLVFYCICTPGFTPGCYLDLESG
jgi:mannose-6-phosphate isomerase-like protein (cupin superfamily)